MILFEQKDTQDFQKLIDELEGSIKVTLYDALNGHNYAKEYLQELFKTNKKLCAKMFKSIEIFRKMGVQTPENILNIYKMVFMSRERVLQQMKLDSCISL